LGYQPLAVGRAERAKPKGLAYLEATARAKLIAIRQTLLEVPFDRNAF
jgi:hypothetical protein